MGDPNKQNYLYGETFSAEAPRPNVSVFELLEKHLAVGGSDLESHAALNDVYKALANNEREVALVLESLEKTGTITREDTLMLVVLFAASRTLGPNLDFLRQAILHNSFNPDKVNSELVNIGLDPAIVSYLQAIIKRLNH